MMILADLVESPGECLLDGLLLLSHRQNELLFVIPPDHPQAQTQDVEPVALDVGHLVAADVDAPIRIKALVDVP